MAIKRTWIVGLVAAVLLAAAGVKLGAASRLPAPVEGVTVPYSGRLSSEGGGVVADGAYDFWFSLFAAATGGEALWSETHLEVQVAGGAFGLALGSVTPLPEALLNGGAWLAVSVRGPQAAGFSMLSPRQQLGAAVDLPTAINSGTCDHTHFGEYFDGSNGFYGLNVTNNGSGHGISGTSYSSAEDKAGVYGFNNSSGPGVFGTSFGGGPGVVGTGTGRGVYGSGADGVVGESSTDYMSGVYGVSTAQYGYGMTGQSDNYFGVFARGNDTHQDDALGDILLEGYLGEIFTYGALLSLYSNGHVFVELDNDNNDDSHFQILSGNNTNVFDVDEYLMVTNGSQASAFDTVDAGQRLMYAVQGTRQWVEDVGTATLGEGGEITITFDPLYAQAANLRRGYQVFVTAACEQPVVLYVVSRSPEGFTVRGVTLDGQPVTCAFDYRVIAPRAGYENARMEEYIPVGREQP